SFPTRRASDLDSLFCAASTRSLERAVMATFSPCSNSDSAIPYPIPLLPPVMRATFPFNVVIANCFLPFKLACIWGKRMIFRLQCGIFFREIREHYRSATRNSIHAHPVGDDIQCVGDSISRLCPGSGRGSHDSFTPGPGSIHTGRNRAG